MQSVNVAPVSLWGAQKVRLLCIYSTSCLSGNKRSVSSLTLCEFSRVLLCIYCLRKLSSSVSGGHVSSDERAREHMQYAVESITQCPKNLQEMRDGKCFTMVYSEQLIKKTKCSITLLFVVFLYFSLNIKADGGASSVWLQTVTPLIYLVFIIGCCRVQLSSFEAGLL